MKTAFLFRKRIGKITKSELEGAVKNVAKSVICKECGNRFIVCVCYNI